jgi:hypothetical protein
MQKNTLITLIIFLGILLVLSGCLQKTQKLGCCIKANATTDNKCVLYNMSDDKFYDLYSKTLDDCNSTLPGYCNVSIGTKTALIPICSDDTLTKCIKQNCTAMVCGDFTYKPRIAPGVVSQDDFEEMVPPESEEETVQGLYNAQCRFYAMDSKLKARMRSSNSLINRFRFGIGGSFDEFDLYKNYFPMSDKYCALNPLGKVDRYMNYLGGDLNAFNPVTEITENCINDSDILAPFTFGNSTKYPTSVLPEKSSYKFGESIKYVYEAVGESALSPILTNAATYKEIDRTFYRKQLSLIYAREFYNSAARAPFECDMQANDCMSGLCKNDFYTRGSSVITDSAGNEMEVATDCNPGTGPDGKSWLLCMPTKSVSFGATGTAPTYNFAKISLKPASFTLQPSILKKTKIIDGTVDDDFVYPFDHIYYCEGTSNCPVFANKWYETSTMPNSLSWSFKPDKDCADTETDGNSVVYCPPDMSGGKFPPAGQIVFFGRDDINFTDEFGTNHKNIIGYAVVDPGEFEKTLFAKNCGLFEPITVEYFYPGPGEVFDPLFDEFEDCKTDCNNKCGIDCTDYCNKKVNLDQEPPSACIYAEQIIPNPNFVRVDFSTDNLTDFEMQWERLTAAFEPIWKDRLQYLAANDWDRGDNSDVAWSSMFWMPGYTGYSGGYDIPFIGGGDSHQKPYYATSPVAQYAISHNFFDVKTPSLTIPDAKGLISGTRNHPSRIPPYAYDALVPKYVYLLKSKNIGGSEKIGKCDIVNNMPKTKQYGWCESCTVNTFAYQEITTKKNPYLPAFEIDSTLKVTNLCSFNKESEWVGGFIGRLETTYYAKCYAPGISDISDYDDQDLTKTGSPRTEPEASLIKERLEEYLKSGIMPVLDIAGENNWDLTSPYATERELLGTFPIVYEESFKFSEYDFKRLLGNNGAMVVIVDSLDGDSISESDRSRVLNRTNLVRSYCWRCLTAVDIPAPDNKSFETKVTQLFADLRMQRNVDILTHSYVTSKITYNSSATDSENAQAVFDNMASYGRTSLKKTGKPLLFKSFDVPEIDPWDESNYEILFRKIIEDEGELVKAGVIGVIYSPARGSPYGLKGLVDTSSGTGVKTPKFCALEKATSLLASTAQRAQFAKSTALSSMNCTACTSIDKALGDCNITCGNGVNCTLPEGAAESNYMCPKGTVIETCKLCNATFGTFLCNKTYVNGTLEKLAYSSNDVNSDLYGDMIGGLKKPDKCCLRDSSGYNYTYVKHLVASAVNAPIIFPKNADPNADCGMASSSAISTSGQFCGVKLPVQDYDIECVFDKKSISDISATLPEYKIISTDSLIIPLQPFSP